MGWALGLAVYFVIWWVTLFAVLPFGIHSQREMGSVVPGSEPGAPQRPRIGRKILITTVIAGALWLAFRFAYQHYFNR